MKKPPTLILLLIPACFACAECDSLYQLGEKYFNQHRFDSAAACFSAVIHEYPQNKDVYFDHGLTMYNSGKFAEAIADFNHSVSLDSQFIDAQFMEAISLERKGELKAAINDLEQIRTKNRDYDEVDKRINNERFAVYIAEKWYYMVAIIFLGIILIAIIAKTVSSRKW